MKAFSIARLSAIEARALLPQLHELLRDAVEARASVGFLPPPGGGRSR